MQNTFIVSPMSQNIELRAGETYEGFIKVANPAAATEKFSFTASVAPYSVSGEGYSPDFTTESNWSMITDWMTLEGDKGTLSPNETAKIRFKIRVPETAPAGGQYATIIVTSDMSEANNSGGMIGNVFEMASIIYANVEGETMHDGQILENYVPGFVATGMPTTKVVIKNSGNVHDTAKTTIRIKNVFSGEEVSLNDVTNNTYETTIMPDSTREFTRELEGLPALGVFEVSQNVEFLDQLTEAKVTMIICPIWFMCLIILTIASIIGMIFYGVHLRKKKLAVQN